MFFKKKSLVAFILLMIIISFAFLYNKSSLDSIYNDSLKEGNRCMKEGFHDDEDTDENSEPSSFTDSVPHCYATIKDLQYYKSPDSDYILKTKIVPPVCPSCPNFVSPHGHNNKDKDDLLDALEASIADNSTKSDNKTTKESVEESYKNVELNEDVELNETNIENKETNTSINNTNIFKTNNKKYNDMIKMKNKEIKLLNERLSALTSSKDSNLDKKDHPACPPCERCPEPAVTCERVVNYRSPNIGKFLPMPVLNDFSTFD